jgi:hypothetical protein
LLEHSKNQAHETNVNEFPHQQDSKVKSFFLLHVELLKFEF